MNHQTKKLKCLILQFVVFVLFQFSGCSSDKNKTGVQGEEQTPNQQEKKEWPKQSMSTDPYLLPTNAYHNWKADTLISTHGFALIAYESQKPIDLENFVGKWSELKMDSLKGHHVFYKPCNEEAPNFTLEYPSDPADPHTKLPLRIDLHSGQKIYAYELAKSENEGYLKLTARNQFIANDSLVLIINSNYALKPAAGSSWQYPKTAIFKWLDRSGNSNIKIFAHESGLSEFDYVEEAPCN
jgi:hypothetical protein